MAKLLPIFCLLMHLASHKTSAYVDMFIDANETSSLIGMPSSLFYVFNGELRQNSIKYHLDIPETKQTVNITWETSNLVNYNFKLVDMEVVKRKHRITVNSTGFVPDRLKEFSLVFNCDPGAEDPPASVNVEFRVYFELNNTMATGYQQLISMPPLNFSIKYHKICRNEQEYMKEKLEHKTATTSYLIAYLIIGALGGFACLVGSGALFMFIHTKLKAKKLHTKYESLHLNQEQQLLKSKQQQLINEKLKNKVYKKNAVAHGSNKKSNPYSKRACSREQAQAKDRVDKPLPIPGNQVNESNIYESVPDGNPHVTETYAQITTAQNENKTSSSSNSAYHALPSNEPRTTSRIKKEKLKLNLTTNTMYSMYNTSMSANNLEKSQLTQPSFTNKRAHIEQCTKFQASQVAIESVLVEGMFSKVFMGKLNKESSDQEASATGNSEVVRVLIKQVNENASTEQEELMLRESCAFRGLRHKNLNTIIGVCFETEKRPFTLFSFCDMGNLKHYLTGLRTTKCKNSEFLAQLSNQTSFSEHPLISTQELLFIMLQMFKALNYLHGKHILHRDVATRNCWLDSKLSLKLSDCALSRDLFPNDYHCLANNENLPVCWLAIETLTDNVMNIQSEIWSCGVFLWECFSLASQPYEMLDPFELADHLNASELNRLQKPVNCPNELYEIYKKSWNREPSDRPTLKEIFYALHKFYSNLDNYV